MASDSQVESIQSWLSRAQAAGLDRVDARLLAAHVLSQSSTWVLAHGEDLIPKDKAQRLAGLIERRAAGEPLAYLIGRREFHGVVLAVDARVLDPRADTEVLVEWALDCVQAAGALPHPVRLADLGTGSGAIALALAQACRSRLVQHRLTIWASDVSAEALVVARSNARALGFALGDASDPSGSTPGLSWGHGSWFEARALPGSPQSLTEAAPFDVIVSNPPYLAADDPHLPSLRHEPRSALVAADHGLGDLHHLIEQAPAYLRNGAWLLLEHGHDQGVAVAAAMCRRGFVGVAGRHDLAGHLRCTGGQWQGGAPPPPPAPAWGADRS